LKTAVNGSAGDLPAAQAAGFGLSRRADLKVGPYEILWESSTPPGLPYPPAEAGGLRYTRRLKPAVNASQVTTGR